MLIGVLRFWVEYQIQILVLSCMIKLFYYIFLPISGYSKKKSVAEESVCPPALPEVTNEYVNQLYNTYHVFSFVLM